MGFQLRAIDPGISHACNTCGVTESVRGANLVHLRSYLGNNDHQTMQVTLCERCRRELFKLLSPGQEVTVIQANDFPQGVRVTQQEGNILAHQLNQESLALSMARPETNRRQFWQVYTFCIGDLVKNP